MVKRIWQYFVAAGCVVALLLVSSAPAFAQGSPSRTPTPATPLPTVLSTTGSQGAGYTPDFKTLSPSALAFSHLLVSTTLLKQFIFQNGQLGLAEPIATLTNDYHLKNSDVQYIDSMLAFSQRAHQQAAASMSTSMPSTGTNLSVNPTTPSTMALSGSTPYLSVHGWVIYFTNWDVTVFLMAAAEAGAYAMAGALTWIASMFGGPVGTVLGLVLAIIGLPTLGGICYWVLQAGWTHRGIYLGIQWNWGWPNIVMGLW